MADNEQRDNNENKGVLFKNKDKNEEHPNWPDYQGNIIVMGASFWLSAWIKTAKSGKKFLSLSVKEKNAAPKTGPAPADEAPLTDNQGVADSLPF